MSIKFILSVFCASVLASEASRILAVFPFPSISHQVVFRHVTQELARRGHDVVVITPDLAFPKGTAPNNLTEIDVHDISYDIMLKHFRRASKGSKSDLIAQVDILLRIAIEVFDAQLQSKEVKKLINDEQQHFDLLLSENCVEVSVALSHVFKVPVISISSFGILPGNVEVIGAPDHPLLYPNALRQKLNELTFLDKISETYNYYRFTNMFKGMEHLADELLKKHFGPDFPTMDKLRNNIDLWMLNSCPVFEGIRPVPSSVVYIGGIHNKPDKKLPQDLQKYLDESKNGVIYVSFGTNVDPTLLPAHRVQTLVNVFSKLPYDVLFKWNNDELPGRTDNIKISKWLPQSDLLKHPKVKVFITQGGLQSTDEAITAGVPLIGIPMLGDQWFNAEKYVYHKIGVNLDMETLTEDQLVTAINTVIADDSYRRNIVKLRALMVDEPMKPLERAVWWIEYVLRHGGAKHLRSPAANITWTEYLELELVLTVVTGLIVLSAVIIAAIFLLYNYLSSSFVSKKKVN